MNKVVRFVALLLCAAVVLESCGGVRKARKARKMEAVRRADSIAATPRPMDSLLAVRADTAQPAASSTDTIETAALHLAKKSFCTYLVTQHDARRGFRTFSGKARLKYEGAEETGEATIVIRIRRDSAIWASVVALGGAVPVARILLTPDSIFYVNFLRREGARMAAHDAVKLLPIPLNFFHLQALVVGEALGARGGIVSAGTAAGDSLCYLETSIQEEYYTGYYNAIDTTLISEKIRLRHGEINVAAQYRMYAATAEKPFPLQHEIAVVIQNVMPEIRHHLLLTFTDPPRFNVPLEFSFSIPKNYTAK